MSNLKDIKNFDNNMNTDTYNLNNLPSCLPKPLLIRSNTIIPQTLDDLMSFCYYVKNNPISEFTKQFKSKKPDNPKLESIYKELIKNPNWQITPSEALFPETFWDRYHEGLEIQNKCIVN